LFGVLFLGRLRDVFQARSVYKGWRKPHRFDRNLVVIGAGSAGLVTAYIAAAVKARVTLIEKHRMGGDCLNTGCVPSKALIRTARLLAQIAARRNWAFGRPARISISRPRTAHHRNGRAARFHRALYGARRRGDRGRGEARRGEARIISPWAVEVRTAEGSGTLTTRAIVIAADARPFVPAILGLAEIGCLTSDNVWELRVLPKRLVVLGGGPIGCELAQCFARFGSQVTQVEILPRLLAREDPEVSQIVMHRFRAEGIDLRLEHRVKRFAREDGERILVAEHRGTEVRIAFDQ